MIARLALYSVLPVLAMVITPPSVQSPARRLASDVEPIEYRTRLDLDPRTLTFSGVQNITVALKRADHALELHASHLTIHRSTIRQDGREQPAQTSQEGDLLKLTVTAPLLPGTAEIQISFEGQVSPVGNVGVYRSHVGPNAYLYSNFEPIAARRAFPCFDEPQFKVPWQLTLHIPSGFQAYSNTNQQGEETSSDRSRIITFRKTPPLPSYLIAFAVGDFSVVPAGRTKSGAPMRVIVPKGEEARASAAAAEAPEIVRLLEDYYGPFPYEKLDHVADPNAIGAMENAGFIIYESSLLLVKPSEDSIARKMARADALAHEMAHHWTGDLVTLRWWDDLWLNEAFAAWMADKTIERWKPEFASEDPALAHKQAAVDADRLLSARKVHQPIANDGDIATAFDAITYSKGASVLRMSEAQIGNTKFQQGMRRYLEKFAHKNADETDFLETLRESTGQDVTPIFQSFLDQPGLPAVTVQLDCAQERAELRLEQRRFLQIGSHDSQTKQWSIPLCLRYGAGASSDTTCLLLSTSTANQTLPAAKVCSGFLEANADELGYYLPQYSRPLLGRLQSSLPQLSAREQKGLLFSQRVLFEEGVAFPSDTLGLMARLAQSSEPTVRLAAVKAASVLGASFVTPDLSHQAAAFIDRSFGPEAQRLGWLPKPAESSAISSLREQMVPFVAQFGRDRALRREARRLAELWLREPGRVDGRSRGAILSAAALEGDEALFDSLHRAFEHSTDSEERRDLLGALGSFEEPTLHERALRMTLHEVTSLDLYFLVKPSFSIPELMSAYYPFVERNFNTLLTRVPRDPGNDWGIYWVGAGFMLCSEKELAEYKTQMTDRAKQVSGGEQILKQTTEAIEGCIVRKKAISPGLREFLQSYK